MSSKNCSFILASGNVCKRTVSNCVGKFCWQHCGKKLSNKKPSSHGNNKQSTIQKTKINFPRKEIIDVEGYWSRYKEAKTDDYRNKYPFPVPHKHKWPGEDAFITKLEKIENYAEAIQKKRKPHPDISIKSYRGYAPSRLDNSLVGSTEFVDRDSKVAWTAGFLSHYVKQYHVIPSQQFYEYVMNLKLPQ